MQFKNFFDNKIWQPNKIKIIGYHDVLTEEKTSCGMMKKNCSFEYKLNLMEQKATFKSDLFNLKRNLWVVFKPSFLEHPVRMSTT